ncbi:MAG: DNA-3-methyladenine glycosylase [Gammaproteobacteria bacterium]|nr:DNA-3-methyladenine glycosylase [Gammaproteobacteria bacterium]
MLPAPFFNRDACVVAKALLGKVIHAKYKQRWLLAQIIETEAYYLHEKGSHASLGFTEKRRALFMPAATIYMYYARGGDSLNISCRGEGNAVLIKSAVAIGDSQAIKVMQRLNPITGRSRDPRQLCSGQTLLCCSLNLKVPQWDQQPFQRDQLFIGDHGYHPDSMITTTRLGIPPQRDEQLPYRFIDYHYANRCSSNPLTKRGWQRGREYVVTNEELYYEESDGYLLAAQG